MKLKYFILQKVRKRLEPVRTQKPAWSIHGPKDSISIKVNKYQITTIV